MTQLWNFLLVLGIGAGTAVFIGLGMLLAFGIFRWPLPLEGLDGK